MQWKARGVALAAIFLAVAAAGCSAVRSWVQTDAEKAAAAGDAIRLESVLAAKHPSDQELAGALVAAARAGQVATLEVLLAHGADPNRPVGVNDWGALAHAIHKGQDACALALIAKGAVTTGSAGGTALRMAAGYGNAAMVEALLAAGADPRSADGDGQTPLTSAVGGAWDIDYRWSGCDGHTAATRALLAAAPDLSLPANAWGVSARKTAESKGCSQLLALLDAKH